MLINARPRFVSNGFETFVPFHRAEALHQRLVEMTNNDVNAWSIFRPLVPSTGESWDGNLDEYSNNENFQVGHPRPRKAFGKTDELDRSTVCTEDTTRTAPPFLKIKLQAYQGL
jgi:hypothetical protein